MEKKKRNRTCLLIGLGLFLIALIILMGVGFISLRLKAYTPPPLVLIHNPYNHQQVSLETGTFVHASARSEKGISRVELWVDGEFVEAQDAPPTGAISPLVLQSSWQPLGSGIHEVIVRAFDVSGQEGLGSLLVEAVSTGVPPAPELPPEPQPGEGTGEEDPVGDSGYSPPQPAGSGNSQPPEYSPAEPGDIPTEDPPLEPVEPALNLGIIEFFFGFLQSADIDEDIPDDAGVSTLLIEALDLVTGQAYEGVHCYAGLGGRSPLWYPDVDRNQSTDESFSPLGNNHWDIAKFLSDPHGITTAWESGNPIPLELTCIGVTSGGTEAVELGHLALEIPPEHWDGVTRRADSAAEGKFILSYRVTRQNLTAKGLDGDIPVPTNLRINERRQELEWDWDVGEDQAGIGVTGFMIYVNNVLVFQKGPASARAARIPDTWLNPPCGASYEFTIRAYRPPYPDGDYSEASEPLILPDPSGPEQTDCAPEFVVEFHTVTTGNFPGDDIQNNWNNSVNSIDGYFFANDQYVSFVGQSLTPNSNFNLADLIYQSTHGMNRFVLEPVEGENIRIGFDMAQYRTGGAFADFCTIGLYHDYSYNQLMTSGFFDETLVSYEDDGRKCQIHYTITPMAGSSLGTGNPNSIPLPWINVVGLTKDPISENLQVHLKNTGSADWTNLHLSMHFVNPDGSIQIVWSTPEIALEVGEERIIQTPYGYEMLHPICVVLDPNDEVLELYEHTGAWASHANLLYCLPRPDLRINETEYNFDNNTLNVHVWNTGEPSNNLGNSDVSLSQISFEVASLTGTDHHGFGPGIFGDGVIPQGGDAWIELSIRPELRSWMEDGYTVIVNPGHLIDETDFSNNSLSVRGGENLRLSLDGLILRWYPNAFQECPNYGRWANNSVEVWIDAYARSSSGNRSLGSWYFDGRVGPDLDYLFEPWNDWNIDNYTFDAYLNGEEDLVFEVRGDQGIYSMGSSRAEFEANRNWGIMRENINPTIQCDQPDDFDRGWPIDVYPSRIRWRTCGPWTISINICSVRDP